MRERGEGEWGRKGERGEGGRKRGEGERERGEEGRESLVRGKRGLATTNYCVVNNNVVIMCLIITLSDCILNIYSFVMHCTIVVIITFSFIKTITIITTAIKQYM